MRATWRQLAVDNGTRSQLPTSWLGLDKLRHHCDIPSIFELMRNRRGVLSQGKTTMVGVLSFARLGRLPEVKNLKVGGSPFT
jgi:hypothetical protein